LITQVGFRKFGSLAHLCQVHSSEKNNANKKTPKPVHSGSCCQILDPARARVLLRYPCPGVFLAEINSYQVRTTPVIGIFPFCLVNLILMSHWFTSLLHVVFAWCYFRTALCVHESAFITKVRRPTNIP
jgi:hypothetical protein